MDWLGILCDKATLGPLMLTAKVLAVSGVLLLVLGVFLAYYLAYSRSRLKPLIDFLVTLPLVFPPIATGFALMLVLGRDGPVGRLTGMELIFSFPGIVLASVVAGLPLMVKPVEAALKGDNSKLA
ncbi:MAG: molybdate ABC transporter permease subunit, partial [Pseudodesulfovibrio sp.]|nr:molybdate ABC transporter permease subunit [Pseudodesulfovibrio sp.]